MSLNLTKTGICDRCGMALPSSTPEGLCPACLLRYTLVPPEPTEPDVRPDQEAPVPTSAFTGTHFRRFGDYELLEEIARGGMGVVFKARQLRLDRIVALKLISAGALATPDLVKRFQAEAQAAASLAHPNIVPIHEIGEHRGQHYFSMGLIEGSNLRQALDRIRDQSRYKVDAGRPPLAAYDPRAAAGLIATLARAVHYAHQRGVLHRDLKPSNILLDTHGQPHLTDFGLAKLVQGDSTLTQTNAILGTPAYMAPEQARGGAKDVTTAGDVYGLGAVLYETLTDHPPFAGGTSLETIRQVMDKDPRRPSLWNPRVDHDLETICLKCLNKEPGQRYSSAAGLAADLERWLRREPIMARRASTSERVWKWAQRRPAIAVLTLTSILLLLSLVVASTVSTWQIRQGRNALRQNRDELRQHLYASAMGMAFNALESGDVQQVRALLAAQRPGPDQADLRGFEWRYLFGQSRTQEVFTFQVAGQTYGCAVSPDGRYLATASGGAEMQLWNLATHEKIVSWAQPESGSDDLTFDPKSRILAAALIGAQAIRLWNVETLQPMRPVLPLGANAHGVAFSPDGRWLAGVAGRRYGDGIPGEAKIWDTATWQVRTHLPGVRDWLTRVKFSPDGRWVVASGGGGFVKVWEAATGREEVELAGLRGIVLGLCFSPAGDLIAGADSQGMIRFWEVGTWKERLTFRAHDRLIHRIAFSPDGEKLASGSMDQTVRLWDVATATLLHTFRGHSLRVTSVSYLPNGSLIASSSLDGTVKLWSTSINQERSVFKGHKGVWNARAQFSPDGRWLGMTTNQPGTVPLVLSTAVFDARNREALATIPGHPFTFAADGTLATSLSSAEVAIWPLPATNCLVLRAPVNLALANPEPMAFSPDSSILAARCSDALLIWSLQSPPLPQMIPRPGLSLGGGPLFSPDGQTLLVGIDAEGLIEFWDTRALQKAGEIRSGRGANTATLALSYDRRTLAFLGPSGKVELWDWESRTKVKEFSHPRTVDVLAFAPDGKTLLGGTMDGTLHWWNVSSGSEITSLPAHVSACRTISFSPDGKHLATAEVVDTIRLWHAPSFEDIDGTHAAAQGR